MKKIGFLLIGIIAFLIVDLRVTAQQLNPITETQASQNQVIQNLPVQAPGAKAVRGIACSPAATMQQVSFTRLPGLPRAAAFGSSGKQAKGHSFAAFWEVGGGFTSTLILRNKDSQNPVTANVVVFSHDGGVEGKAQLDVTANSVSRLSLKDIIKTGDGSIHWGGLMLEFPDVSAAKTVGDVVIENYQQGVIFDLPLLGGYRYDTENALHAPFWLIDKGTDGTVTLFNQSDQAIVVSPAMIVEGTETTLAVLSLASHETKKLSIRELVRRQGRESNEGSIALRYTGPDHALAPALLLANPDTGFSLVSAFNARHNKAESGQATWRFPDVFLSSDPRLGFKADERLTAYALLSNTSSSPLSPKLTAYAGSEGGKLQTVVLPVGPLRPLETRLINLSRFVASGLLPGNTPYISLSVSHQGVPGDLGLTVFSVGQAKDFVSRSEGLVRSGQVIDSTYWDISGDLVALLLVQNAGDVPVQSKATLYYQTPHGTASYSLPPIDVPVNGSRILNLKQIILAGAPDSAGNIIPASTTFGTLTLEVVDKSSHGLIFGGSSTFDPVKGRYGLGIFPTNCDLCANCEICVEPTDTGGICEPDCSDPSCCFEPPPPAPTAIIAIASPIIGPSFLKGPCNPLLDFQIVLAITYQVLDQDGTPFASAQMEPQEEITNFIILGVPQGDPEPNWVDIGPTQYPGTAQFTNASGQFIDAPFGQCVNVPFTNSFTQPVSVILNGTRYLLRTNNWNIQVTDQRHGTITNGSDVKVTF